MADGGEGRGFARLGFLAMCFAVLGLTGMLATHVAQLPLERAMAREAVLDRALVAARAGDAAGLEGLRPLLGDSARAILPAGAGMPAGPAFEAAVAAERVAMRARLLAEAREVKVRMTAMLGLVALLAGGFGAVVMLAGRRVAPGGAVR